MQNALKNEIKRLSQKAFMKAERAASTEKKYQRQFEKRTGLKAGAPKPSAPPPSRHFDPRYCARNANWLAKTIWHKVLSYKYEPSIAVNYLIPKADGSKRSVMAFSIPDAALANITLRRARTRNLKRLSPSSYAYHPNKNVFDAVIALNEFEPNGKLFAVQIDFEKYFDNIPSSYIREKLNDEKKISLTPHEKHIFEQFLIHKYQDYREYSSKEFSRRHKGTPQGSSVSLLLANLANHDLDTALSAVPGRFVRFADDVVALSDDYQSAQIIEKCFINHCRTSGLVTNSKKSPGIAIISEHNHEIRTYRDFDYLGYRFSSNGLGVPDKVVRRIKQRISRLCNIYLLYYLRYGYVQHRSAQVPIPYDWDLLGFIYELRNSLYGGLSEEDLSLFINGGRRLPQMKGLMGFYCLIEDPTALRELDGWILSVTRRAMKQRNDILKNKFMSSCPTPSNKSLSVGNWLNLDAWDGEKKPDQRMPSLIRGWRAARKHYYTFGLESVQAPTYDTYSDISKLFEY
ncbi:Reverse transcriptase domain-containing protein [Hyphomicrobiales bacterium]|nr:Reverse transcriptase domain-containing protein [Hyphomicrobiales bacterium]CAH1699333.1 Reverse transcriptase domain-containing protein [Hyphomicrobiales bacterium]CAI0343120.1 RNA-directed DNA polymerase [Hyphomicrobiales bacterium]